MFPVIVGLSEHAACSGAPGPEGRGPFRTPPRATVVMRSVGICETSRDLDPAIDRTVWAHPVVFDNRDVRG